MQALRFNQLTVRGLVGPVRRHPLAAFFALAYLLSWSYWIPVAMVAPSTSHLPGLAGPLLAGVIVTAVVGGRSSLADLIGRVGRWRVAPRWWAVALLPLALGALGVGAVWASGGARPSLAHLSTFPGAPAVGWLGVFVLVLVVNGFGEEVGWRGVAWPLLRRRHGLARAALLVAIPWALWHLPVFWLDTGLADLDLLVVPGWLVGLAAGSLVLGWLYDHARSSLLVVAVFHASLNMASATEGTAGVPAAITSAAVILGAVLIGRASRGRGRRPTGPWTPLSANRRGDYAAATGDRGPEDPRVPRDVAHATGTEAAALACRTTKTL